MPFFDQSLYRFALLQPSWWEADTDQSLRVATNPLSESATCDVAIIGGGYTGLSAAYHLAKDYGVDVRVLEAGRTGWGASGRNGGFCCMGGTMLSTAWQIRKFGLDEVRRYHTCQAEAVDLVRSIIAEEHISAEPVGDGEMVVAEKPSHYESLKRDCEFQREQLGLQTEMIPKEEFRDRIYDAPHQHGALLQKPGFGLHPLKYCHGLARAASERGAGLHECSEVVSWRKEGARHFLETKSGGELKANHVFVACNGFMPEHLNKNIAGRVLPLQSQIIVTRPLTKDELEAHSWKTFVPAINSRNVYFYYRLLPGNRFMIGGRAGQNGTEQEAGRKAYDLQESMASLWPEWRSVEIEFTWRGLVCFTSGLRPSIGRLPDDPSVSLAYGYHGNGVNNATWAGRELAKWFATGNLKDQTVPDHLPALARGLSPKFPLPSFRQKIVKAGIGWHRLMDMIG